MSTPKTNSVAPWVSAAVALVLAALTAVYALGQEHATQRLATAHSVQLATIRTDLRWVIRVVNRTAPADLRRPEPRDEDAEEDVARGPQ